MIKQLVLRIGQWFDHWPWWLKVTSPLTDVIVWSLAVTFRDQLPDLFIGRLDVVAALLGILIMIIALPLTCWAIYKVEEQYEQYE